MRDHGRPQNVERGPRAVPPPQVRQAGSGGPAAERFLALQRLAGNQAVAQAHEQDAHAHEQDTHTHGAGCGHPVQRSAVHEALRRPGTALAPAVRADMETRLGADFSDVRVHTDAVGHEAAEAVDAHAFTSGAHIVFQRGRYDTASSAGRTMLAHELTHVIQQRSGPVAGTDSGDGLKVSDPSDRFEREAEANAARVMSTAPVQDASRGAGGEGGARQTPGGGPVQRVSAGARPSVQRAPKGGVKERADWRELGGTAKDVLDLPGQSTTMPTASTVGSGFRDPDASTVSGTSGAVAGAVLSLGGAVAGAVSSGSKFYGAHRELGGTAAGTAQHHGARRERNVAGGEFTQNAANTVGNATNLASAVQSLLGVSSAVVAKAAAGGGAFTLVASLVQGVRDSRKADHARKRADALAKLLGDRDVTDANDLRKRIDVLQGAKNTATVLTELIDEQIKTRDEIADLLAKVNKLVDDPDFAPHPGLPMDAQSAQTIDMLFQLRDSLTQAEAELKAFETKKAEALATQAACREALLEAVAEYAHKKNKRGVWKKGLSAASAFSAAIGGAAGLAASIAVATGAVAGAGALAATPVGWAFAGLAASLGLMLAAYKTSKFLNKRWKAAKTDENGVERPTRERLLLTINVFRKLGPSKREIVAGTLFDLAREEDSGHVATSVEDAPVVEGQTVLSAKGVLHGLGLDWTELKAEGGRDAAVGLIGAKLAS
ncbi:eCIS core domain-containing protein [Actinomadura rupiterrae]|uniref:eCIS core domain-containing protein n=1 Tax=Actinomadura rupiterrae TaxID=559627 RepID=UPI0020A2438B|nr:DUF4157 domain-containing protein [Actinomadura rupiterrae]MCP2342453.1 hypothetical protein [Actinomadura rupiterrae]